MKKILLTIAATGLAAGAFAQGTVILENDLGTGYVTLVSASGTKAPLGFTAALLWYNGTSFVQEGPTYTTASANQDGAGFFNGETVTIPTYTPTGTFEVKGSYVNGATTYTGTTASFVNHEGQPSASVVPQPINGNGSLGAGGWNGNLVLTTVPEPSTIALGGLGAAALLLFRRRK